ncbi:MAG: alpha/beta hydrolase [Actinomycetota bacterium]|nr:alpha/beta hydrolase [Actinomycetota bacterium]
MSPSLRFPPALVRPALRVLRRTAFDDTASWARQRAIIGAVGRTTRVRPGTTVAITGPGGVAAEVITAPGADRRRVLVHFHGGGYTTGVPALCRAWASGVSAESGVTVVLPHYRLAPEAPAPAATDDARAVWDDLSATVPAESIVVSGDSAGAGMALALTQALRVDGRPSPGGLILISPWLDLTADRRVSVELVRRDCLLTPGWLEACVTAYAGNADPADPSLSPLFGSLAGLPPVLVQVGTDDLLIADADRFVTRARSQDTEIIYTRVPGLWHDFPIQAGLVAAADRAVTQAAGFVIGLPAGGDHVAGRQPDGVL